MLLTLKRHIANAILDWNEHVYMSFAGFIDKLNILIILFYYIKYLKKLAKKPTSFLL